MGISVYDPDVWNEKTPANVLGGRSRAKLAERDILGRFQPKYVNLPHDKNHGKSGGLKRAQTGKRDEKGRYCK